MGKQLVIVESPAKARTIGRFLGRGYEAKASMGHVRDLPRREMGVSVDDGSFKPDMLVWAKGMGAWTKAGEVPELSGLFGAPPLPAAEDDGPPPLP